MRITDDDGDRDYIDRNLDLRGSGGNARFSCLLRTDTRGHQRPQAAEYDCRTASRIGECSDSAILHLLRDSQQPCGAQRIVHVLPRSLAESARRRLLMKLRMMTMRISRLHFLLPDGGRGARLWGRTKSSPPFAKSAKGRPPKMFLRVRVFHPAKRFSYV